MDYDARCDSAGTARHTPIEPVRMTQDVETEIKLAASPAMLAALRDHPRLASTGETKLLQSTYFDTVDGRLAAGGASLRVRACGGKREQTLKLATSSRAQVQRAEWNVAMRGEVPVPDAFPQRAREALAALRDGAALLPYAVVRVEREMRRISVGGSVIEVAFDQGAITGRTITGGSQEAAVCELELELVSGHLADVLALALALPLGPQLRWSLDSKAARCQQLGLGRAAMGSRATAPTLSATDTVAQGFQAIGWACLGQLLANTPEVVASGQPEAVHQARVAIRRLRASFSLFAKLLHGDEARHLAHGIKALADAMGPARDLFVLGEHLRGLQAESRLLAHIESRLAAATDHARAVLAGQKCQCLLFDLALWLEQGKWLKHASNAKPLPRFTAKLLDKRRKRLGGMSGQLAFMHDGDLHDLRIHVKKLRYAIGFFAPLFEGGALATAHEKLLGKLQDALGEINDMAMAESSTLALFGGMDHKAIKPLKAALDAALASTPDARERLIAKASRLLEREATILPWWHSEI